MDAIKDRRTKDSRKGQTLLEAMIALSILTAGFLGITSLLVQSFELGRVTADQTTATYLAAEGIEVAKNLIDHDVYGSLATPPTTLGWNACFLTGGSFQLDYTTTNCATMKPYDPSVHLTFDPTTHLYGYGGPVTTPYAREVRISVPNQNEIVVDSVVTWSVNSFTNQSVQLEDAFYNWHP